jgi:hypothetical protein
MYVQFFYLAKIKNLNNSISSKPIQVWKKFLAPQSTDPSIDHKLTLSADSFDWTIKKIPNSDNLVQISETSTGLCLHSNAYYSEPVTHGCEPLNSDALNQKFTVVDGQIHDFWGQCLVKQSCDNSFWRWNVCSDPDTLTLSGLWFLFFYNIFHNSFFLNEMYFNFIILKMDEFYILFIFLEYYEKLFYFFN